MAHQLILQPRSLFTVPLFLAPAFSNTVLSSSRSFTTSPQANTQIHRGGRDKNRKRGVSAIRSTGPRYRLSVTKLGPLPKPVADPTEDRAGFDQNVSNHGLWGFFNNNKETLIPPNEEDAHGRAWTKEELSKKGWQDLHKLYWVCVKEANVVRTRNNERERLHIGYGLAEGYERLSRTMRNIRQALIERHYARFDAAELLKKTHIYELFPDILHREVDNMAPELLEIEESLQEEASTSGEDHDPLNASRPDTLLYNEGLGLDGQGASQRKSR